MKYFTKINKIIFLSFVLFTLCVGTVFASTGFDNIINEEGINLLNSEKNEYMIDVHSSENTYKFSESGDIYLPYARFCTEKVLVDKDVETSGVIFSQKSIDINSKMSKNQILFSQESVRINEQIDDAIIFSEGSIVVDSVVTGDLLLFAGDTFTITENGKVRGDILVISENINIEGTVLGSVIGATDNVKVTGLIENDLRIGTDSIDINDESVLGKVYVSTNNSDLRLSEKYSDAIVKYVEKNVKKEFDLKGILESGLIASILFTIVYLIVNKKTNSKLYEKVSNKTKQNLMFAVAFGCISLIVLPFVMILLFILSLIGLYALAVPVLIIVTSYILICGLLSTLIVGSLISYYMDKKYFNDQKMFLKGIATLIIFFVLHILARLPYIGGYVTMILVILAIGIVATSIFKKETLVVTDSKKDSENANTENK